MGRLVDMLVFLIALASGVLACGSGGGSRGPILWL